MNHTPRPPAPAQPPSTGTLGREHRFGKQLLFYAAEGPLGGTFSCSFCAMAALQPELIDHAAGCPYRSTPATATAREE